MERLLTARRGPPARSKIFWDSPFSFYRLIIIEINDLIINTVSQRLILPLSRGISELHPLFLKKPRHSKYQ